MSATSTPTSPTGAVHTGVDPLWEKIKTSFDDADWLLSQRKEALEIFRATPMPSRVSHLWRYTDPALFVTDEDTGTEAGPRTKDQDFFPLELRKGLDASSIAAAAYLRDGCGVMVSLDPKLSAAGVVVMDLREAVRKHPGLVREHLGSLIGPSFGRFEAYNSAAWTTGLLIYVPREVEISKPIHIVSASANPARPLAQRLLVIAEDAAVLTLIDEYGDGEAGGGGPPHVSSMVEMSVGAGARVKYAPIENWGTGTISYFTQRAKLQADAQIETVMTTLGGRVGKVDCGAILAGRGAESNMFGLAIGGARQQFDHHTAHDHQSGNTRSDLHFKVALRGRAHSAYTGLIRIEDKAPFCEAYQENRNLLLSSGARAESIPELEILNNEVRCTHGATVGKVNPEEIFYLGARGIDPANAMRLIVTGFVEPILAHIPDTARDRIHGEVLHHLGEA